VAAGRGRVPPVVAAAVVALVLLGAIVFRFVVVGTDSCQSVTSLRVAATPELTRALREIADGWTAARRDAGDDCVQLVVEPVPSATMASRLTVLAGNGIDVAAVPEPNPDPNQVPAVWVPDSTAWLRRVATVDRAAFGDHALSVASSPVIVAMPAAAAASVGGSVRLADVPSLIAPGGPLTLAVAEPRRETAGLAAAMLFSDALAPTDDALPGLVRTFRGIVKTSSTADLLAALGSTATAGPVAEQAVYAYNATSPPNPLVGVAFEPAAPRLDYPYAIRAGLSVEVNQAAEQFRDAVLAASPTLFKYAFRTPGGGAGPGFPDPPPPPGGGGDALGDSAKILRTLALWGAANAPSRTLALLDVTSSMGTSIGGSSRSDVMAAAAQAGLELFTPDSQVGLWAFGAAHQEVLPIGALTAASRDELQARMAGAAPTTSNQAQLYQTLLDAYKVMLEGYEPGRPNLIVVLTDGADSDTTTLRREQFKQDVQRLADPARPIRVVLIGIGASAADASALQEIAAVVGGGYFPLTSPDQIQAIFLNALLRVG
jgi:Ca-activated chloride channel family protein